jgi:GNAT superfamily N-acetyltransferase
MTAYETLRPAGEDREAVPGVLTEAFMDDPVVCWLFPDEGERRRLQPYFHGPLLTHPAAEAYLIGEHDGAAIWLSLAAGQQPYEEPPAEPGTDLPTVFGENGARLLSLGRLLAQRHPHGEAHLYLPCMGVLAARRGNGLGSALLRGRLERADADGLGTYLEASSPRSRALYARHGFVDLGEPVRVPDGPPLWPMWRTPHGSTQRNGALR